MRNFSKIVKSVFGKIIKIPSCGLSLENIFIRGKKERILRIFWRTTRCTRCGFLKKKTFSRTIRGNNRRILGIILRTIKVKNRRYVRILWKEYQRPKLGFIRIFLENYQSGSQEFLWTFFKGLSELKRKSSKSDFYKYFQGLT